MKPLLAFCIVFAGALSVESVIRVTEYVGRSAVIRCPYKIQYKRYPKYLCRGRCIRIEGKDIPVQIKTGDINPAVNGRFSLHDDTTARVFTVTITGLTAEDSGKYWCGIGLILKHDMYTEVELNVIPATSPSLIQTPAPCPEFFSSSPFGHTVYFTALLTIGPAQSSAKICDNSSPGPTLSLTYWVVRVTIILSVLTLMALCSSIWYRRTSRNGPLTEDKTTVVLAWSRTTSPIKQCI